MYSTLFKSTTIPVLQQAIAFNQARHVVLAGNIANMDTPGYLVRDLSVEDFQHQLKEMIERRHSPQESVSAAVVRNSLAGTTGGNKAEEVREPKTILHHDKSNVGVEYQVTEMVKNQMQHNMALTIMNNQLRLLETAISERL
ncbi:MAG: flagellar basal body rod protein FlgB [Planctomycetaceae bacterium]|nr:flagellar basal body rod protein FlgB [Planctomycetaceae bacterium]